MKLRLLLLLAAGCAILAACGPAAAAPDQDGDQPAVTQSTAGNPAPADDDPDHDGDHHHADGSKSW